MLHQSVNSGIFDSDLKAYVIIPIIRLRILFYATGPIIVMFSLFTSRNSSGNLQNMRIYLKLQEIYSECLLMLFSII